ncbi:MAG TPA: hypothetical protein VEP66_19170 [Myxococcales bacterium]|nr:hypothetical protein [Myxococcales bacterium]
MALRDLMSRLLAAILLCGTAARGEAMQPLIERPVSLPAGKVDLTLHGTYTHWTGGVLGGYLDMRGLMAWLRFRV